MEVIIRPTLTITNSPIIMPGTINSPKSSQLAVTGTSLDVKCTSSFLNKGAKESDNKNTDKSTIGYAENEASH